MENLEIVKSGGALLVAKDADSILQASGVVTTPLSEDQSRSGILEYWFILRRHKSILIVAGFLGAVLGYLYTLPQTPIYQARASVEIEDVNPNFLNIKEVNPVVQASSTGEGEDLQTQIRLLQSRTLMERVVAKMKTQKAPAPTDSTIDAWKKALKLSTPAPQEDYQGWLSAAAGSLKVRTVGFTRIVEMTADSPNPETAARFVNTLGNEFIEQSLETRWQTTQKTTEWLTRQLEDMRIKLENSEDRLQRYAREAGLIFTDEKTNVSNQKLGQLQMALSAAQTELVSKQSRFEMAEKNPAESVPDVINDEMLTDQQSKLTDLRRQIADLTATYTADYPKVKRLQAEYRVMEAAAIRERAAIISRIHNEYEEASRREKLLLAAYDAQAKLVAGEGGRAIQYNIYKREVDSNRSLYDTMLSQLKQANIASALHASNIRVVDPATTPRSPYKPNPSSNATTGFIVGLLSCAVVVVMRDRADRSLQEPGDSPYYLKIPELGIIPSLRRRKATGDVEVTHRLGVQVRRRVVGPLEGHVELVTWNGRSSGIAESFRSTLISLIFSSPNGKRPRVLVFTSAAPGEGKSTVTSNLAIALTETGQRVLLIDGDLRKPRQHTIFGIDNSVGLTNLLKEKLETPAGETLDLAIFETKIPNLFLMPAGRTSSSAASLLYGPNLGQVIKELRERFDWILIDTPPMLQIPDARIVGRFADRVVLVVRSGRTTKDAANAAIKRFREDGIAVLGTILNAWNPDHSPAGYYGYYGKYYKQYQYYYHTNNGTGGSKNGHHRPTDATGK